MITDAWIVETSVSVRREAAPVQQMLLLARETQHSWIGGEAECESV